MASVPMPAPEPIKPGPQPYTIDSPIASVWSIEDPSGETPPKAFVVMAPQCWGPFYTAEEVRTAFKDLRATGEVE